MADKQIVLSQKDFDEKTCPACGCSIEIIEGHWILRDCALCAWCRRWFALPAQREGIEILRRRPSEIIVKPERGKGS